MARRTTGLARERARRAEGDLVFRALADPTRRDLLRLLARGEHSAGALARHFAVSRPAVSKHLAVLRRAKLVRERREGRERHYTLDHPPLREAAAYLERLEAFWQERLGRLGRHLDEEAKKEG